MSYISTTDTGILSATPDASMSDMENNQEPQSEAAAMDETKEIIPGASSPGAEAPNAGDDASAGGEPLVETLRILEALLFASDELLPSDKLKAILPGQPDGRAIRKMVDAINAKLSKERHPFEIVEIGGGYHFRTVAYYYPWVQHLFKEKAAKKLSIQSLECLAIIAYKQPITKAEIEIIRGVISDGAMKTLLEKHLITVSGRSEKAGRPLLYATTREFLQYFGINKIIDLPRIEEFEALAKEKLGELSDVELQGMESGTPAEASEEPTDNAASVDENSSARVQPPATDIPIA
jgi:segregation and condensation protein B